MKSNVATEPTSQSQGLRDLTRGVLGEAQAEARQILEDARARAASARQEAQEQADARREEILQRAHREMEPVRSQAVASAQIEAQRLKLQSRERLLNEVFTAARDTLRSAPERPDYANILRRLIREATASLAAEDVVVHADEQTQAHLSDAFLAEMEEQLGVHLQRGQALNNGDVGIVVETPNGHRRYRDTLEARLERLQDTLRAPVYRILRGGSP
jgi:V/A-type H+-transporting ATPase subunit E